MNPQRTGSVAGPILTLHTGEKTGENMKYRVKETYTPDDPEQDRSRAERSFHSESTNIIQLAIEARTACYNHPITDDTKLHIITAVKESADQLEDQTIDHFDYTIFGNSGEWQLDVKQIPTLAKMPLQQCEYGTIFALKEGGTRHVRLNHLAGNLILTVRLTDGLIQNMPNETEIYGIYDQMDLKEAQPE